MVRIWSQQRSPLASIHEAPLKSVKGNSVYGVFFFFKGVLRGRKFWPSTFPNVHSLLKNYTMLNAGEFNRYSQCCFLNPTCISPHLDGYSFLIIPCRLSTDLKKTEWRKKYAVETENENCSFLHPLRADIRIFELFDLGLSVEICRQKIGISSLETAEGSCVVRCSGGRKASIFVLTSANLFPGIRVIRGFPSTNQIRQRLYFRDPNSYIAPS